MTKTAISKYAAWTAAVLISFTVLTVQPQELFDDRWYGILGFMYSDDDDDRFSDTGAFGVIGIGKGIASHVDMELTYAAGQYDGDVNELDWKEQSLRFDMLFYFFRRYGFSPYFVLGSEVVANDTSLSGGDAVNPAIAAGFGFKSKLHPYGTALRGDVKYRYLFYDGDIAGGDDFGETRATLALVVPFGQPPRRQAPVAPPVVQPPPPDDSDGDGVPDSRDRCPNTPRGVPVNAVGCAQDSDNDGVPDYQDQCPNTSAGVAVDSRGCPADSDGDGVPDSEDLCPNTPPGEPVDRNGCSQDADGDGVPNAQDRCPNTPPGVEVNVDGCQIIETQVLRDVHFEFDKSRLTASARQTLDGLIPRLRDLLDKYPGHLIEIAGHTDSIGTAEYNRGLSDRRAASVLQYLISRGMDPSLFVSHGYGESQPIASNQTDSGRAQNRRTEVRVLGKTGTRRR